jgi:Barstar (barnase inhibitor)
VTARLAALVSGAVEPGLYRWPSRAHPGAVQRELARAGWRGYLLAGPVTDAPGFVEDCAGALAFPGWVGHNRAALADRLADLSWLPGRGHVLLWERYGALAASDGQVWRRAYATLEGALAARQRYPAPPLFVLLRGTGPATSPVDGAPIPVLPAVPGTTASAGALVTGSAAPVTGSAASVTGSGALATGSAASVTGSAASVTGSAASRRRRAR